MAMTAVERPVEEEVHFGSLETGKRAWQQLKQTLAGGKTGAC